jgi:hypothetical protein
MNIILFTTTSLAAATAINASAVPDKSNTTAAYEFEKRFFSCPFSCDMQSTWCMMGDITKQFVTEGGKVRKPFESCRCRRSKDEPRCAKIPG